VYGRGYKFLPQAGAAQTASAIGVSIELNFAEEETSFRLSSLDWGRILKNCAKHQYYQRQLYDAALNNFARLSMSAALASPITK
jgi:hypothetical protein